MTTRADEGFVGRNEEPVNAETDVTVLTGSFMS
jgi:hypothetical protein